MAEENNGRITLAIIKNDLEHIKHKQEETDKKLDKLAEKLESRLDEQEERIRENEMCIANLKPLKSLVYGVLTALISTAVLYSIFFFSAR